MRGRSHWRRRAFASVMAIAIITLMGAAILAMSSLLAMELRRTNADAGEAQLRQLLLAGAAVTAERLRQTEPAGDGQDWQVAVPPGLAEEGATLRVHADPASADAQGKTLVVEVQATLGKHQQTQTLRFARAATEGGTWALVQAQLQ